MASKLYASVLDSIGNKYCDVIVSVREIHTPNNKELKVSPSKLDSSVLNLTGIKSHCYVEMFHLHKNASYVAIVS